MAVDLLYTAHNRRAFSVASFEALLANTNWELVNHLHVVDDMSTDGTGEYLADAVGRRETSASLFRGPMAGSVNAINLVLGQSNAKIIGKIDNDFIVCPGWLEHMLATMNANPQIDALGMEPGFGEPLASLDIGRRAVRARWIGGIFLARRRAFRVRPRQNDRYFGLTAHWRKRVTAWISPDLPVFLLDHLNFEPWRSLTEQYIAHGWQRRWPDSDRYPPDKAGYWDWWLSQQTSASVHHSSAATS